MVLHQLKGFKKLTFMEEHILRKKSILLNIDYMHLISILFRVTAVVNFNFCSINQWIFLAFKLSFYWFNYSPFVLGLDGSNEMFVFAIHDSQSGTFLNFKLIQLSADEKNSPREWRMTQELKYFSYSFNWFWPDLEFRVLKLYKVMYGQIKTEEFNFIFQ